MSIRSVRRATLALFVAAALALAAPAAAAAAPRTTPASGWLAVLWGGLQRVVGAQGGCIDPDGARCKAQTTGGTLPPAGGAASAQGKAGAPAARGVR